MMNADAQIASVWHLLHNLVESDGTLQRHSVSYAEELRPLATAEHRAA